MPREGRWAKSIAKFRIRTTENLNPFTKMSINKAKKRSLNLKIRSLAENASPSMSLDDMIEKLHDNTKAVEKQIEKNNPLLNNVQIKEQVLPDNLDENKVEQNFELENILGRIYNIEQQIQLLFSKYQAEKESRLKLSEEINKCHNDLAQRLTYLEEKLQNGNQINRLDFTNFIDESQEINEPVIPLTYINLAVDNFIDNTNAMPQLEKEKNLLDVEIVDEINRDYKLKMPKLKKENETTNKINEWPIITLEEDYSKNETCGSSRNLRSMMVQVKNERDDFDDLQPSSSKY